MTGDVPTERLDDLRQQVRAWCVENVPRDWRSGQTGVSHDEFVAFQQDWLATLRRGGYAVPHWPAAWGGGYSLHEQAVIYEELARADAPRLVLHFVSLHHAATTLLQAGTEQQQKDHLPKILDGEVWCQGFSEPDAGSDLASLRARAIRDGDVFVVNGQKIWASVAMYADWCLLLARTDPSAPKHQGISYFMLDMRSPGIEVRPIRQPSGAEHFCEIFLNDVEIPAANLLGAENDGWRVALQTLSSERGATMVELAERLSIGYRWLLTQALRPVVPGEPAPYDDSGVRDRLGRLASEVEALRLMCRRVLVDDSPQVSSIASMIKLYYSELLQRMTGLGVELAGLPGQVVSARPMSAGWESGEWLLDYLGSWEWTIPGGTSEIQRTIIGERVLGLPKEKATK